MSTPSLEKTYSYHDITQYVNAAEALNLQLQKVKCLRHRESGDWLLDLDFYPSPRRALWVSEGDSWGWLSGGRPDEKIFLSAQNPLSLYLKSHFIGRRLGRITGAAAHSEWDFGEGYSWSLRLVAPGRLEWTMQVPGKKPFVKELKLFSAATFIQAESRPPLGEGTDGAPAPRPRAERLLANVREDLASAKEWITRYAPLCAQLELRPWLWHTPEATHEDTVVWGLLISELQGEGLLPKNREASHLKAALDKLFNERSRQERKVTKAAERLADLESRQAAGKQIERPAPSRTRFVGGREKEKTHPGLRVEIAGGIYAYLGRNSRENELLFKWVRDRDFWFHVRGYSGSHLWILRSEAGIARDATLPHALAERAAKVALWNSKLKNSGSGPVDFTEKRHLKKLRGEAGQLKIDQSEVLFVTLEEGFEKTLKWG